MNDERKATIEVDMTDDEWIELLCLCEEINLTPGDLAVAFCQEVIPAAGAAAYYRRRCSRRCSQSTQSITGGIAPMKIENKTPIAEEIIRNNPTGHGPVRRYRGQLQQRGPGHL